MFIKAYNIKLAVIILLLLIAIFVNKIGGLQGNAIKTLVLIAIMLILWLSNYLPFGVVALLPVLYAPLMGLAKLKEITNYYSSSIIFLILGGMTIGVAIQKTDLHKRIAFYMLSKFGKSGKQQVGVLMLVGALLSMFIKNVAVIVMLLPIVISIISALNLNSKSIHAKGLLIALAYGTSIGGMATIIGTSPNTLLAGLVQNKTGIEISFVSWFIFALPLVVILLSISYWFVVKFFNFNTFTQSMQSYATQQYNSLGRITVKQVYVIVIFLLTAFLWMFGRYLPIKLNDIAISLFAMFMLFGIPTGKNKDSFILQTQDIKSIDFNILLLIGGGFALGALFNKSGLGFYISQNLQFLSGLHVLLIMLFATLCMAFLVETTNHGIVTATLVPIFLAFAVQYNINPLLVAMPMAMASSTTFMLPIASPPNAVVYSSNLLNITDMLKSGVYLNIISIIIISIYSYIAVPIVF